MYDTFFPSPVWDTDILCVVFLVIGFIIIFVAADGLMDNLRWIAEKFHWNPVVIGVIILGLDPEECIVSILAAFRGLKYVAIGNVIGNSMMANTLCFSLPFLLYSQSFLNKLSEKLKNDEQMKIPTFYFVLITISCIVIALNSIPIINQFQYNLLLLALINLLLFVVYIIKNFIAYSRYHKPDIHIEPSSDSSSSSSSDSSSSSNSSKNKDENNGETVPINIVSKAPEYGAVNETNGDGNAPKKKKKKHKLTDQQFRRKKILKCAAVLIYLAILIGAGELCVLSANVLMNNVKWLNQSIFGYIILSFVTNAEEMMYAINAFRKNKISGYALGVGGMIGKLYFNINITYGICGLVLGNITFRNIDIINSVVMVISTIYLSMLLSMYHFSKIHGVILFSMFIGFVVYNIYFAEYNVLG